MGRLPELSGCKAERALFGQSMAAMSMMSITVVRDDDDDAATPVSRRPRLAS